MNERPTNPDYSVYISRLLIVLVALASLLYMTGCSSSAHTQRIASYDAAYAKQMAVHQQMVAAQASQPDKLRLELYPNGTLKSISMSHEIVMPNIQPYKPPEDQRAKIWAGVANTALRTTGTLIGIGLVGNALSDIVDSAGTTVNGNMVGSYNQAGGDLAAQSMLAGDDIGANMSSDHHAEYYSWQDSENDNRNYEGPAENIDNENNYDDHSALPEPAPEE